MNNLISKLEVLVSRTMENEEGIKMCEGEAENEKIDRPKEMAKAY